jgi:hypothetical protein
MIVRTPLLARQVERSLAAAPQAAGSAAAATGGEPGKPPALPPAEQVAALIAGRRAVFPKDMNGQAVSRGEIEQLLAAANWAPTHKKTQPWRFVVMGEPPPGFWCCRAARALPGGGNAAGRPALPGRPLIQPPLPRRRRCQGGV